MRTRPAQSAGPTGSCGRRVETRSSRQRTRLNTARAMIYSPLNVGRNFDETLRGVDALQFADNNKLACPANWKLGDAAIVPPPTTSEDAD